MSGREAELVDIIRQESQEYVPRDEETVRIIGATVLVPVIAPSGTGKNTLLDIAEQQNPESLHKVRSWTTRSWRPGEPEGAYVYRPHTASEFELILDAERRGITVQLSVFDTDDIYGSEADEYRYPYSMLDAMARSVDSLRRAPFGDIREIGLVAPPGDYWPRLQARRLQVEPHKYISRLFEATYSLAWMLQQEEQGRDLPIVVNPDGRQHQAAREITGHAQGTLKSNPANREVAVELLDTVQFELKQLGYQT